MKQIDITQQIFLMKESIFVQVVDIHFYSLFYFVVQISNYYYIHALVTLEIVFKGQ